MPFGTRVSDFEANGRPCNPLTEQGLSYEMTSLSFFTSARNPRTPSTDFGKSRRAPDRRCGPARNQRRRRGERVQGLAPGLKFLNLNGIALYAFGFSLEYWVYSGPWGSALPSSDRYWGAVPASDGRTRVS